MHLRIWLSLPSVIRQSGIFSPPFSRLSCFRITNLVILKQDKRLKGGENISDWRTPNFLKALFGCRRKTLKSCSYLFHFLQVLDEIQDNGIKIYTFPDCDSEDDEEFVQINQELKVWFAHFSWPVPESSEHWVTNCWASTMIRTTTTTT